MRIYSSGGGEVFVDWGSVGMVGGVAAGFVGGEGVFCGGKGDNSDAEEGGGV